MFGEVRRKLNLAILIFILNPMLANAQTGIELTTTIDDIAPPGRWLAMLPGQDRYVADKRNAWGTIQTPPGSYNLLVIPHGKNALPIDFGRITVTNGKTSRVVIDSGVRLTSDEGLPHLRLWTVEKPGRSEPVAQVVGRWGVTPVPPGNYVVKTNTPHSAVSASVSVASGMVTELDVSELEIGYADVEKPPTDACLLFGGEGFETVRIFPDNKYLPVKEYENHGFWARQGDVEIQWSSGSFIERQVKSILPGKRILFAFDMLEIARTRGYSFHSQDSLPKGEHMTVTDRLGNRLVLSDPDPDFSCDLIAPGDAIFRIRENDRDQRLRSSAESSEEGIKNKKISLVVESPIPDSVFEVGTENLEIVGQASAATSAGATRVVVVVDTSVSTRDSAGIDLNNDNLPESIFDAEIVAVHRLIDELVHVEGQTPGTAFAVSLVEFGRTASITAPFTSITDAADVDRLKRTLDAMTVGAQFSDTYYDRAIDAANRALDAHPGVGPRIILMVTDGKPSDIVPALDAAARAGNSGTVIHAIGLGKDFSGSTKHAVSYPPIPEDGVSILSTISSVGAPGGRIWSLPNPGDIVQVVAELPVLEREDARIAKVTVRNLSANAAAQEAELFPDGAFRADVPVDFRSTPDGPINRLEVVAVGRDGDLNASQILRVISVGTDPALLAEAEAAQSELASEVDRLKLANADLEQQLAAAKSATGAQERLQAELVSLRSRLDSEENATRQCQRNVSNCEANLETAINVAVPTKTLADGLQSISLSNDILFAFDAVDLREAAAPTLNLVAQKLRRDPGGNIRIEGHSDGIGSAEYNQTLSERRADAVRNWLVELGKVETDRIEVLGLGETKPLLPETKSDGSDDPEARQTNRRVEILIQR